MGYTSIIDIEKKLSLRMPGQRLNILKTKLMLIKLSERSQTVSETCLMVSTYFHQTKLRSNLKTLATPSYAMKVLF